MFISKRIKMEPSSEPAKEEIKQKQKNKITLDLRIVVLVLLAIIAGMITWWQPWEQAKPNSDKTIKVSGEATVTSTPDEYVFYPSYQFENTVRATALAESTAKSNEIVAKLKALGVPESKIKSASSGYDSSYDTTTKTYTYTLNIIVTVNSSTMAQKVQDYLITSSPTGSVSPYANFSKSKQNKLENQARDEATKDAKAKADQMAKNLGFKLGKVKSVDVDSGFGGVYPMMDSNRTTASNSIGATEAGAGAEYKIQPGENDLDYSVSVTYYIK